MSTLNKVLKLIYFYDPKFIKTCLNAIFKINQKKLDTRYKLFPQLPTFLFSSISASKLGYRWNNVWSWNTKVGNTQLWIRVGEGCKKWNKLTKNNYYMTNIYRREDMDGKNHTANKVKAVTENWFALLHNKGSLPLHKSAEVKICS